MSSPQKALPPGFEATWPTVGSRVDLTRLARELRETGYPALKRLSSQDLLAAWCDVVETFLDPHTAERRLLQPDLQAACRLSEAGLEAALSVVLRGVVRPFAADVFERAQQARSPAVTLVVLASNLPGLAVQPLLAGLARRRPLLLKCSQREPFFGPAFVAALGRRLPELASALAALSWTGGDRSLEMPLLRDVERVLAYGDGETLADLEARAPGRVFGHGPKLSLAVLGRDRSPQELAPGLARDIALFDQRGCLSLQAIYVAGPDKGLASALAGALSQMARELPPGPLEPGAAATVQQLRLEAVARDLELHCLDLPAGTVVVEPNPELRPSPGLRTVRIHPLPDLDQLPALLSPFRDRLQGAALWGADARELEGRLRRLGVSRIAAVGELQAADATWQNGGVDPLQVI